MKKLLSYLVILTMVLTLTPSVYAESNLDTIITDFSDNFDTFAQACTDLSESQVTLSALPSGTNRIIAKFAGHPSELDNYNASEVLIHDNIAVLQFNSHSLLSDALVSLNKRVDVLYAEEDVYVSLSGDIVSKNWGIPKTGLREYQNFLQHESISESQVVVAVVDSGIQTNHPYFANSGRLIDGYNFYDTSAMTDNEGHGTHVAGIIAANTPDNVKIQPYKAFNSNTTDILIFCNAVNKAIENKVDVINLSLTTTTHSNYLHDLLQKASNDGIIVVAAAGNNKDNTTKYCPADSNSVITVTASTENDVPDTSYSNYGSSCDIAAPGTAIYSTYKNSSFAILSGTSMAAPFVSAAAAIIKGTDKTASFDYVLTTLKNSAFIPNGWNTNYGVGILNMYKLIQYVKNVYVTQITINYSSFDRLITVQGDVHGDDSPVVLLCQYDEDKLVDVYISNTPDITYSRFNNDVTSAKLLIWNHEQTMLSSAKEYVF